MARPTPRKGMPETMRELERIGFVNLKISDTNGRKILHIKDGNVAAGIMRAIDVLADKAGLSPDLIMEEYRRRHQGPPRNGRRRP